MLMAIFAIMEPRFLSSINLFNVIIGLLAIGMTFLILTAGIDLSVGSLLAFAELADAAVAKDGMQDCFTAMQRLAMAGPWPHFRPSSLAWPAAICRASPSRPSCGLRYLRQIPPQEGVAALTSHHELVG
jgi:ribose/xylose/arabinose/galactoside ABC-type transport system permease subunit